MLQLWDLLILGVVTLALSNNIAVLTRCASELLLKSCHCRLVCNTEVHAVSAFNSSAD